MSLRSWRGNQEEERMVGLIDRKNARMRQAEQKKTENKGKPISCGAELLKTGCRWIRRGKKIIEVKVERKK
ncbi:hypothetical protein ACFLZ9_01230 [Patescibacteria group bacterium]